MDEILSDMIGSFAVSENNVHGEHPHFSAYKNEGKIASSQRQRRESFLQKQAENRDLHRNRIRGINGSLMERCKVTKIIANDSPMDVNVTNAENLSLEDSGAFDDMDFSKWGIKNKKKSPKNKSAMVEQYYKKNETFRDYLMFSEWLVDIPHSSTFSTDWIMVPCPIGKRCLLVANNGITSIYGKSGYRFAQCQTVFPGGSRFNPQGCTMLDCILDKAKKRYFVLDLLCWNSAHSVDTEFVCRQFFLRSRFSELPEFSGGGCCLGGGYSFHLLPSCQCTVEEMTKFMNTEFDYDLDGLLYYHSKVFYTPGQTPLVGWLKPWMLPEILNVEVPLKYVGEQGFYNTSQQFIDSYNIKHKFKSSIVKDQEKENSNEAIDECPSVTEQK